MYSEAEAAAEQPPYRDYRTVLRQVMRHFGSCLDRQLTASELERLADSLPDWPPFSDTVSALRALHRRYRLAIISNIDDDRFAASARRPYRCSSTGSLAPHRSSTA